VRSRISKLARYVRSGGLGPFLVRAMAGSGVVQLAGMLVTFLVGIQLARGLGVEGYGYYGIAMAVISVASIPGEFGLPRLVVREVAAASTHQDLPRLFGVIRWADRISVLVALPASAAMAVGAYLFVDQRSSPVAVALALGAPIVPLVALTKIRGGILQGMHFVTLGQVPAVLLRPLIFSLLLLGLFTVFPDAGVPETMALNTVTAAIALLTAHLWLRPRLPRPRPTQLIQNGRQWLASSFPMALTDGLRMLQAQLVILLVGIMASPEQVGLFRIAVSTALMVAVPVTLVNAVIAPVLARLNAQGDMGRLQRLSSHSAQLMTAGALILTLPILFFGPDLLTFVFGSEYAPAQSALLMLCVGQVVNAGFGPNGNLLVMSGHERRVSRAMAVSLVCGTLAVAALVPWLGILGAAIASTLFLLTWNLIAWRDTRRLLGVDTSLLAPITGRLSRK